MGMTNGGSIHNFSPAHPPLPKTSVGSGDKILGCFHVSVFNEIMNALSELLTSRQGSFLNNEVSTTISPLKDVTQGFSLDNQEINTVQIKSLVCQMQETLAALLRLLGNEPKHNETLTKVSSAVASPIIEGVFDGEKMIGADGAEYAVPANYASKSKLVEGDILKLMIGREGRFVFKQIAPVERERRRGELVLDTQSGQWSVRADGKNYKVLKASVTFYKGRTGDEAVFLVPKDANGSAAWGAVENIIHQTGDTANS